uniref:Uncharacterized protein n=1 Tax=Lotus japonicus TaxID=34305 RepID=I3SZZ8_LOTJA|nr:unknown [Lotus japonicus]
MCLHFDIDKQSVKGNESKSIIVKSTRSKKEGRVIKQLQKSIPCQHEVGFSSSVLEIHKKFGPCFIQFMI